MTRYEHLDSIGEKAASFGVPDELINAWRRWVESIKNKSQYDASHEILAGLDALEIGALDHFAIFGVPDDESEDLDGDMR